MVCCYRILQYDKTVGRKIYHLSVLIFLVKVDVISFLMFLRYELFTYTGEKVFAGLTLCPAGVSCVGGC